MDDNWKEVSDLSEDQIIAISKKQKLGGSGPPPLPPPLPPPAAAGLASSSSLPASEDVVVENEEASEAIASPVPLAKLFTFDELNPFAQFGGGIQPEALDDARIQFAKLQALVVSPDDLQALQKAGLDNALDADDEDKATVDKINDIVQKRNHLFRQSKFLRLIFFLGGLNVLPVPVTANVGTQVFLPVAAVLSPSISKPVTLYSYKNMPAGCSKIDIHGRMWIDVEGTIFPSAKQLVLKGAWANHPAPPQVSNGFKVRTDDPFDNNSSRLARQAFPDTLFTSILISLDLADNPVVNSRQSAVLMQEGSFGEHTELVRQTCTSSLLASPVLPDSTSAPVSVPSLVDSAPKKARSDEEGRTFYAELFMRNQSDESRVLMLGGEVNASFTPQFAADNIIFKAAYKWAGAHGSTLANLISNMNDYASIVQYCEVCPPPNWIVPALAAQMGVDRRKSSRSSATTGGHTIEHSLISSFRYGADHYGLVFDHECAAAKSFAPRKSRSHTQTWPLQWQADLESFLYSCNWDDPAPLTWYSACACNQFYLSARGAEYFLMKPYLGYPELYTDFHAGVVFEADVNKQGVNNVKCAIPNYGLYGKLTYLPKMLKFMHKHGHGIPAIARNGDLLHSTLDWTKKLVNNTQYNKLINEVLLFHFPNRIKMGMASHSLHGAFNAIGKALNLSPRALNALGRWYPPNDMTVTYATREECVYQFKVRKHIIDAIIYFANSGNLVGLRRLPKTPVLTFITAHPGLVQSRFYGSNAV